ncbi:YbaL family putative K(+) efflux transporter [Magnetospirillum fulvum]|uniref:Kef-type potassium/proton antiporter, CPA2 family (TC 2.A.37.1) n=1 Tax=Magnetospirillum fulvum TaxID=1082 RepID=A0A1H6I4B8_MAGFU|nr:YbaL family putative K(+) efflux transporter [Magnetospirillum fulvum]SEH42975.1 Kef-type potassium/proton antiporter, CPA2 family (TC 2.A.37.1) [Magnetospirillum fulvum]
MHHEASLIATISMSLLFAFGGGWIASKLKLPPLVGYLLAGIAVGPFTPGFVADSGLAQQLAEIGVILLMFGVGLHFSVRELWAVRWIALPGAVAQIAVATTIGAVLASVWGWSLPAGLVFGLALSVASTVVLLRALEERNAVQTLNGSIAVGWLIVEDLATVIALVLLPPLAAAINAPQGAADLADILPALGMTLAKVALFIAIVLIGGRRVVPWILDQIAKQGSRELFTLAVLALALGIAYLSSALFGVSFALGAFFAGVVMSESDLSHQATADSMPLKEAFAVLFFVSVGMLFDPSILLEEPLAVLAVLAVIIVGKSLAAFAIVLLFRYPVSTALIVSASLAQIGEFSFILAALGLSLGLLPPEGQAYILAGALLSIALNPLLFWAIGPLERWLRAHPRLLALIERSGQDRLADLPPAPSDNGRRDHAVIVGFGRVGRTVAQAFDSARIPYVVIEQNRQLVTALRGEGLPVLYGDASVPGVLDKADIGRARLLVVAIPDGFQVRQVVAIARTTTPELDIVARTHSEHERDYLLRQGVGLAVMGEHQLALAMTDYALDGFTASQRHADADRDDAALAS